MLDLIATKTTNNDASTTAPTMDMPVGYSSGDLLVALVAIGAGNTLTDSTGDWTFVGTASTLSSRRLYILKRVADGTEDATYTLTLSSGTVAVCHVMAWRGQDGTTPIISQASADRVAYSSVTSVNSPTSMTTGSVTDCAIIHAIVNASGSSSVPSEDNDSLSVTCFETAVASTRLVVGYTSQAASGAITQVNWLLGASQSGLVCTIAIAPATANGIPPKASTPINSIAKNGYTATTYGSLTGTITSLSGQNINLTGTDYPAGSISATTTETGLLSTADGLTQQFADYHTTSTATVSGGEWVGAIETLSPVQDYDGKLFSVQFATYQNASSGVGGKGGTGYIFADSSGNWAAYAIQDFIDLRISNVYCNHIACGGLTPTDESASPIDWTDVKYRGLIYHRNNSAGSTSSRVYTGTMALHGTADIVFVGGSELRPIGHQWLSGYFEQFKAYKDFEQFQGSRQLIVKMGMTFGDGTTPTYVDLSQGSVEVPPSTDQYWRGTTDSIELKFVGGADDVFDWRAGVFRANTSQKWTLASDAGASWLHSAASWIGPWDWDNQANVEFANATWSGCRKVKLGAAAHSLLTIADTAASDAAASFSGNGSLSDSTIDGTGADYALELGTSVTAITLADCTLTAGTTDKVHVLKTSGTVTITISGTTSLASGDVTSAGATVVISAPAIYQEVQITNLVTGSRVQIYDLTNDTELANEIASGTTVTWTDGTAYVADRDIMVRISYVSGTTAKEFIEAEIGTVGDDTPNASTLTYRANQVSDSVYNDNAVDGSAVTGVTFTDSSVDVMNIDVAANSISWPSLYAAWVYYAFSETGIATDIDYIEAVDTANYLLSNLVVKNTSSPSEPLEITGGYGRDSTTLAAIDLVDTSGGTIVMAPDHVVSYAVGSGVTSQDKVDIAAEVLSQASSAPIHANVQKVNDITIDGSGIPPTYDSEGNLTDPGDPFVAA